MQLSNGPIVQLTDQFVAIAQKLRPMLGRYKLAEDTARLEKLEGRLRDVKDALNLDVELDELTAKSKQQAVSKSLAHNL